MPLARRSLAALLSFIIAFAPLRAAAQMVDVAAARGNSAGIFVAPGLAAGTIAAAPLSTSALAPIPSPSLAAPSIALPSPAAPAAAMALAAAPAAAASVHVEAKRSLVDAGGKLSAAKPTDQAKALESVFSGSKGDAAIPGSQLADDKIIYRLWQLAKQSKSTRVKIGSMVVDRKGKIIGEDWNRASTPAERKLIGVGIILHAEQGALAQAWHKTKGKLEGARVYAMGISRDAELYVRKINPGVACKICARSMERFHVSAMSYSSRGFKEFFWNEVLSLAKNNAAHRWWQTAHKDDPNVTWQPIAEVQERLRKAGVLETRSGGGGLAETLAALKAQPFLQPSKHGLEFLKGLTEAKPAAFLRKSGFTPRTLASLEAKLGERFKGLPLTTKLYGPLQSLEKSKKAGGAVVFEEHAVFLGVFERDGKPAGLFSYVVAKDKKTGELAAELHSVYFDKSDPRIAGIGDRIVGFLREDMDPALDVRRETIKADYAGRYAWAKRELGFRFSPTYYFYDIDGKTYKGAELARRILRRLLAKNGMSVSDLRLGGKPVLSVDDLTLPADFAELTHRSGRLIRVRPLVNDEVLDAETPLPIGKALMMGNYLPKDKRSGPRIMSSGGKAAGRKFGPDAMPFWWGYRDAGAEPEVHPERTAMTRSRPSIPVRLAKPLLKGRILDYGAGRGKDTRYLKAAGLTVQAYDPFYFPNKPSKAEKFDWIMLNYVLNVIRTPAERNDVLQDVAGLLKPGGRALVSVRGDGEIEESRNKSWKRDGDGWITPHQTFQHGYSQAELESRLQEAGLKVVQVLSPLIVVAEKAAAKRGTSFGKQTPQAVYYHRSLEKKAPARLTDLVDRARKLLPRNARWNLIKVDNHGESVSFLRYPDFDTDAHPALRYVYRADLKAGKLSITDHGSRQNPFILHRKDSMVGAEYPLYAKFRAITMKEEAAGLLNRNDIGTRSGWEAALKTAKRP